MGCGESNDYTQERQAPSNKAGNPQKKNGTNKKQNPNVGATVCMALNTAGKLFGQIAPDIRQFYGGGEGGGAGGEGGEGGGNAEGGEGCGNAEGGDCGAGDGGGGDNNAGGSGCGGGDDGG